MLLISQVSWVSRSCHIFGRGNYWSEKNRGYPLYVYTSKRRRPSFFIEICSYYRKFVKDFTKIAKPLHRFTENNSHDNVKQRLRSLSILLKMHLFWPTLTFGKTSYWTLTQVTLRWARSCRKWTKDKRGLLHMPVKHCPSQRGDTCTVLLVKNCWQ